MVFLLVAPATGKNADPAAGEPAHAVSPQVMVLANTYIVVQIPTYVEDWASRKLS